MRITIRDCALVTCGSLIPADIIGVLLLIAGWLAFIEFIVIVLLDYAGAIEDHAA